MTPFQGSGPAELPYPRRCLGLSYVAPAAHSIRPLPHLSPLILMASLPQRSGSIACDLAAIAPDAGVHRLRFRRHRTGCRGPSPAISPPSHWIWGPSPAISPPSHWIWGPSPRGSGSARLCHGSARPWVGVARPWVGVGTPVSRFGTPVGWGWHACVAAAFARLGFTDIQHLGASAKTALLAAVSFGSFYPTAVLAHKRANHQSSNGGEAR
jgi:hypothetical protein